MSDQKPTWTSSTPTLIVGGGLGGLALAQALRQRNIPYRISDRDSALDGRRQGWNNALHWIISDFLRYFPDDLAPVETLSHLHEHNCLSEGTLFDGLSGKELTRFGATPPGRDFIRAERPKLRAWLATNVEVEWDKKFSRYEEGDDQVNVYFADGSSATGCMLIGADGANSSAQLLGPEKSKLKVLPMDVYTGELTLTKKEYLEQFSRFARSLYIAQSPEAYLYTGLRGVQSDGEKAEYYWMVFRHHTGAEKREGHSIENWSKEKLYKAARETVKRLDPRFHELLDRTKSEVKGEGGNHAMKDGIQLVELINNGLTDICDLIKKYEEVIMERGRDAVQRTTFAAMNWVEGSVHSEWQNKLTK